MSKAPFGLEMKVANVVLGDGSRSRPDWVALRDWLKRRRPDIVALQKTGPISEANERALNEIGYAGRFRPSPHPHLGVAVLNRRGLGEPEVLPGLGWEETPRFLAVRIGKLRVCSLYVPWCDPETPRAAWLDRLRDHVDGQRYAAEHSLLCGDFNVSKIDSGNGPTVRSLRGIKDLGFADLYRERHPDLKSAPGHTRRHGKKHASRLHLILASTRLTQHVASACVDVESRPWPRKDAPPVVVDLDL